MIRLDDLRVEPIPGEGMIVRRPGALLALFTGPGTAAATRLRRAFSSSESNGPPLARALAGVAIEMGSAETAPFCLATDSDRGLVVMVHGSVQVRRDGEILFDGDHSPTWVDGFIDATGSGIEIAPGSATPSRSSGPWDLRDGSLPVGAVLLAVHSPDIDTVGSDEDSTPYPGSSQGSGKAVEPAPQESRFELIDLSRDATLLSDRQPLSLDSEVADVAVVDEGEFVTGVFCGRDHLNHPDAHHCARCGLKMVHRTQHSVKGLRPPLGLLVLDDGATFALDHGYVLGREPESDSLVKTGGARPLKVTDSSNSVSRIHAEVRLDGWEVLLVDRGSSNGTFVHEGDGRWRRLDPERPHPLDPGSELSVGERRFVFESNVVPRPL